MTLYRAAAPDTLRIVPLDVFTAFYHHPSATTHLLSEPAPQLLAALQAGPASLDDLLTRLGSEFDVSADDRDTLLSRLDELVATGLVGTA